MTMARILDNMCWEPTFYTNTCKFFCSLTLISTFGGIIYGFYYGIDTSTNQDVKLGCAGGLLLFLACVCCCCYLLQPKEPPSRFNTSRFNRNRNQVIVPVRVPHGFQFQVQSHRVHRIDIKSAPQVVSKSVSEDPESVPRVVH